MNIKMRTALKLLSSNLYSLEWLRALPYMDTKSLFGTAMTSQIFLETAMIISYYISLYGV